MSVACSGACGSGRGRVAVVAGSSAARSPTRTCWPRPAASHRRPTPADPAFGAAVSQGVVLDRVDVVVVDEPDDCDCTVDDVVAGGAVVVVDFGGFVVVVVDGGGAAVVVVRPGAVVAGGAVVVVVDSSAGVDVVVDEVDEDVVVEA